MVLPGSAAAASAIWLTRRGVRGVAQISQHEYHHHSAPQTSTVAPLSFRPSPRVVVQMTPSPACQWTSSPLSSATAHNSITDTISRKIREKFSANEMRMNEMLAELNRDVFWSQYATLPELAKIESKLEILKIVKTFLFISKKSIYLFNNFSRKIIANIHNYSASELAEIVNAFAQLGFLEESFCVQIANRVVEDTRNCPPNDLVLLLDGYASTRCHMSIVNEAITKEIEPKIDQLTPTNIALLSSCLARLNLKNDILLTKIESEFSKQTDVTARDVTLTAYAFSKLQKTTTSSSFQSRIIELSNSLIRDFTAKELQMISSAFDKWSIVDKTIYGEISIQAQRRIAQFSADTLIHLLRAMVSQSALDDSLVTRVVTQLPRMAQTLKPSEVVNFWTLFKDSKISSCHAIEVMRPLTVMRAGSFNVSDWIAITNAMSVVAPATNTSQEIVDAFVLISELPAKYKNTLTPVSSTILEKMNVNQLTSFINAISNMKIDLKNFTNLVVSQICGQEINNYSPSEASELYCALVALNAHESHQSEMINLMTRALTV